jgi:cytochrome c2
MRLLGLLAALLAGAAVLAGCGGEEASPAPRSVGDPDRGATLIQSYNCGACHVVPGIRGASGQVGPPLNQIGSRTMLAGMLPNTPPNMLRWLQAPQSVVPGNGMPNMEMSEHDARDIAAYLYTLR